MSKIKVGIIFGGFSKEREISFAGGRTVYDNLNKSLFEAIPVFVDSFGNFVLLDWEYVYKGSIRDFYPPSEFIHAHTNNFQIYAESLGNLNPTDQKNLTNKLGKQVLPTDFKKYFVFAFLCLHGPYGEDGRIQGLLEYFQVPYSGSGILPSSIGIDKAVQKKMMVQAGFNSPPFFTIDRDDYILGKTKGLFGKAKSEIGFPMVVKPAHQGSSIGVSILNEDSEYKFMEVVEKALFTRWLGTEEWLGFNEKEKLEFIRANADIREGIGMPLEVISSGLSVVRIKYHPEELSAYLDEVFQTEKEGVILAALDGESTVLVEGFIDGKEFSCIVIQAENGYPIALPPTEIRKGKELFDYRSKYLPGLSRKITPINLPDAQIEAIRKECERLFVDLHFDVYARIDGFINQEGKIFLNDPNTTSGMMPSSFFFHQAAEIGLNPSQFLTYLIRTSLAQRIHSAGNNKVYDHLLIGLDKAIEHEKEAASEKIKVAVLLGGYSSERHISVESGRNIYEKLASSTKFEPIPVFLIGNSESHAMYQIPINLLLKDNADDIREKIEHFYVHDAIKNIIHECEEITNKYSSPSNLAEPLRLTYEDMKNKVDFVFIALHGRPGEDGAVQAHLDKLGIPYNGSGVESSQITIDKYKTNEILKENGFLVAEHMLVYEEDWIKNEEEILQKIQSQIGFPFIAKPVDDGCSSAVKKIKTKEEFEAFAKLIFRKSEELDSDSISLLNIKPKEEFPVKKMILVEELIGKKEATHFLEITGGMLTKMDEFGVVSYQVFEASEALSEGEVLSLEEKFLAGQGQNITPARYSNNAEERQRISDIVKEQLLGAAKVLNVTGYCRIDAFVRIYSDGKVEVIFIEVNSLPGMTPATCIFHQAAIAHLKPLDFIDYIINFGIARTRLNEKAVSIT